MAVAIVPQKMTLRDQPIAARDYPAADKDIGVTIPVEIANRNTGAVLEDVRQRVTRSLEIAMTVV